MIVDCKNVDTYKVTKSHSEVFGMQLFELLRNNAIFVICENKHLYHTSKNQFVF